MATREEDLFRQYNDKLVNAIVEPTALAVSFYSKNMIARGVKDRVCEVISVLSKRDKSGILLDAIEQYISTQPDSQKRSSEFLRVLSVLKTTYRSTLWPSQWKKSIEQKMLALALVP